MPEPTAPALITRRHLLRGASIAAGVATIGARAMASMPGMVTGAATVAARQFQAFAGRRIGLITNQTGRIADTHLVDLLAQTPGVQLAAIFAPEHGFRGAVEAGATVADGRDSQTGVPIFSLYGATKAPTPAMLRDVDVLVFDIQDIGARFYTYISTMGLAMQAAAQRGIPFVVLDRPNPLGGEDVSGFVHEVKRSFVGQYPIPIVHGMSVGELARMIQGERWIAGLDTLDLQVVPATGWRRRMRFPATRLPWVATSPNIPTFTSALVYPGIGMVGETLVNEGRGTPFPFQQFGAPWLDAARVAQALNAAHLPGVSFTATRYTPRAIANVAATPRFRDIEINAIRLTVTTIDAVRPLDIGMHALALLVADARRANAPLLPEGAMFTAIAGTPRLRRLLDQGATGADIIASWQAETAAFKAQRQRYLLY